MLKAVILTLLLALWSAATRAQALDAPIPVTLSFESQVLAEARYRASRTSALPQVQSKFQIRALSLCFWRADVQAPAVLPADAVTSVFAGRGIEDPAPLVGELYGARSSPFCGDDSLFGPDDPEFERPPSAAVPEPATSVLLLLGGLGLLFRRLR